MLKNSFLLFIAFLFISLGLQAQKLNAGGSTADSKLEIRKFNENSLIEFKLQKEFNYAENSFTVVSIWDRFWKWFWHQIGSVDETSGNSLTYFLAIICTAAIIFAVIKLSGMDIMQILTGKPTETDIPYFDSIENIHGINFDQNIEIAVSNKNYRLAVRILYLKSLKTLSDSGFIDWQISKTNSAYVNELNHPEKKQEFLSLTKQFECIWYGGFYLKNTRYQDIERAFKDFVKKI